MTKLGLKVEQLPPVRGRYTENAPLGEVGWFRAGGRAEVMFKPADREDLASFLAGCPEDVPITVIGVMSNMIVRDGGIPGVVIRMGRSFAEVELGEEENTLVAGGACLDINVAQYAARQGLGGMEFLSGVPGTIGGALRMNAGAYGAEMKDVLVEAEAIDRDGMIHRLPLSHMGMSYRHSDAADDLIFTSCVLRGQPCAVETVQANMAEIKSRRAASQPIKARTGGSTFANPLPEEMQLLGLDPETRSWQLVDGAGCRGLVVGGAQMSEKHCNFMINTGNACSTDLEKLGEEVRRRVFEKYGYKLRWEIRRIGEVQDQELKEVLAASSHIMPIQTKGLT